MSQIRLLGICMGLLAAAAVLAVTGTRTGVVAQGPMISECDGRIRSVAIQYVQGSAFAIPIYRQFLADLPADVTVYSLCPDRNSFAELCSHLGAASSRLTSIITNHPMTAWSRDRWVSLSPGPGETTVTLVAPAIENGAQIWPERLGDERIAEDLAYAIDCRAARSGLYFDGGDLLADARSAFVAPAAIARNIQHTAADASELARILRRQFGRDPILLPDAPDHHVGMFMMAAGENRLVVGDPTLAKPVFDAMELPGGNFSGDFSPATQKRFDSVAEIAAAHGYRVTRIPCVPSTDGKTYITYVNGIIDQRDGARTIYMPTYQNQPGLNAAAEKIWRSLGYRVEPIDVTSAFRLYGTLHCLVNVIAKS